MMQKIQNKFLKTPLFHKLKGVGGGSAVRQSQTALLWDVQQLSCCLVVWNWNFFCVKVISTPDPDSIPSKERRRRERARSWWTASGYECVYVCTVTCKNKSMFISSSSPLHQLFPLPSRLHLSDLLTLIFCCFGAIVSSVLSELYRGKK